MVNNPLLQIKPNGTNTWLNTPACSDYKMTSTTLVDSARNSKGYVVSTIVREGIRKIELKWNYLSLDDFAYLAQLFEGTRTGGVGNFFCYCTYFDTIVGALVNSESDNHFTDENGNNVARLFYVGDRVCDTANIKLDSNNKPIGYTNVSLSLIEV